MEMHELRCELESYLKSLNIQTFCVDHPPVFTVEEMMPHVQGLSGAVTKNLFLKDKKKKGLWLVSVRHDRVVNLNDLAKKLGLGSGNLRFAEEATMKDKLKVGQGCATALALFCDKDKMTVVVPLALSHSVAVVGSLTAEKRAGNTQSSVMSKGPRKPPVGGGTMLKEMLPEEEYTPGGGASATSTKKLKEEKHAGQEEVFGPERISQR
ncbi:hypothetical protein DPEC_G00034390 [Dallia pectoralis]|uniref:Uncharacterized protein n=1 Tax=Dallia pectoralis TaxID=75939 RepID=A0ACC2HDU6_DALPE|nr:hypothetical protein DPEC_G00034390 [Dallia pectoralis]